MKRAYFEVPKPRIEIIPMIDIMMFLLVFFIIITLRMISGAGVPLNLPKSTNVEALSKASVTVGVKQDGAFYLDGRPIAAAELQRVLEERRRTRNFDVVIAGDKAVPLQTLIQVMDIVRAAGIYSVGIAARDEP